MGVTCGCMKSKSIVITQMSCREVTKQYDNTDVEEIEEEAFCTKFTRNYILTPNFFKQQFLITKEREETNNLQQENDNNSKFLSPISETSNQEDTKNQQKVISKLNSKRASLEQRFLVSPSQIKRNSLQQKNSNKIILFNQKHPSQEQRERRILLMGSQFNEKFNKNEENK